jgi:hypothetical protein
VTTALSGTGIQTLLDRTPAGDVSFGSRDIDDGPTSIQEVTVRNAGTQTVTLSQAPAVSGDFAQVVGSSNPDCVSGTVLAANETCKLRLRFDPSVTGTRNGTATVKSNAADVAVNLDGQGLQTEIGANPTSLAFGKQDIDDGAGAAKTTTIKNTGTQPLTVTGVAASGAGFAQTNDCVQQLDPNETCTISATFDPATVGDKPGSVAISSSLGDLTVPLTGTGTQTALAVGPASLALGNQDVDDGPTTPQAATITNAGTEPVTLTGVNLAGGDFDRPTGAADDCANGTTLNAGETCKVRVRFDPSSTGDKSGTVTVASNVPDVTIPLAGTGIQTDLARDPTALDFGTLNVGAPASAAKESTFTNAGTQPIALSGASLTGGDAAEFRLLSGAAGDCAAGVNLAPGATCKLRAAFDPSSSGAKAAIARVASDAGPDVTVTLAGTATPLAKLALPAMRARASKVLRVKVTVANGAVRNITVRVRSRSGKVLAKKTVRRLAPGKRTVPVRFRKLPAPGRYVTTAQGKDVFGNTIKARNGGLRLTGNPGRARTPSGGGGSGGSG